MIDKRDEGRDIVIRFWDHCKTNDLKRKKKPILCQIMGTITNVSNLKITVSPWWILNEDKPTQLANAEIYHVVRSCIVEYGWIHILKWFHD